ncbi:MAG: hypothetical protein K2G24_04825 [Muribaculaceae bacterium]|nr:hypothetical protein [Muribaculaceae bacterium]
MQELILNIDYLLRNHDCVIVPGIGAFIATVREAAVGADGTFTPPARMLAFNQAVDHNDGLIAASYARRMECGVDEAGRTLAGDIAELRQRLDSGESIAIGDRGILSSTTPGSYSFEAKAPEQWLPSLRMPTILEIARDNEDRNNPRGTASDGERIAGYLRKLKIAASVAVILALGFVLSTPAPIDNAQLASPVIEQFKPRTPEHGRLLREPGQQAGALQMNAVADESAVINADTAAIAAYKADIRRKAEALKHTSVHNARANGGNGKYCLVVASLNNGEEARKFLDSNKPMKLHVLEKDGRYRVYAISGNSIEEVKERAAASNLANRFPGAWVCRK